jgi:hypothetical protein
MSYSASDLQNDIDRLLERLGLEITGDDGEGFTIKRAGRELALGSGRDFNTGAEAAAVALEGLIDHVEDLISAAKVVIGRWERGDLAEAVRELDLCVRAIDEAEPGQTGNEKTDERMRSRLRNLHRDGLQFSHCVDEFGVHDRQAPAIAAIRNRLRQCDALEVPARTVVNRDERGLAVMAWARLYVNEDGQADSALG